MDKLQAVVERRLWESRWLEQEVNFFDSFVCTESVPT